MELFNIILLAVIQGITEFLPISSSAHLILFPKAMGVADQGVLIDVSLHIGTLGAVMLYFRAETASLVLGSAHILTGRLTTPAAKLTLLLALATIPVVLAGLALKLSGAVDLLRSIKLIGWTMLSFGVVLWLSDRTENARRNWNTRDAMLMGFAQALALLPGTSRSGITMTAARFLGYERREAARLSLLMSIPTIIASGVLIAGDAAIDAKWDVLGLAAFAAILAFIAAYAAIAAMMRMLMRFSFTPFVIYRIVLGLILLWIAYT